MVSLAYMQNTPTESTIHLITEIAIYVIHQSQGRPYAIHEIQAIVYAVYNLRLARMLAGGQMTRSVEDEVRLVLAMIRNDKEDRS